RRERYASSRKVIVARRLRNALCTPPERDPCSTRCSTANRRERDLEGLLELGGIQGCRSTHEQLVLFPARRGSSYVVQAGDERQRREVDVGTDTAGEDEVLEVGGKSIGYIDSGGRTTIQEPTGRMK